MQGTRLKGLILLVAGLALWTALGLVSIHVPFGRDQGVAAYVAEVMAHGGVIYKDVFHFNLPGIFFVYRWAMFTGLPWPESINLVHVVFTMLTYLALYFAGRRFLSPLAAAAGANFYAAFETVMYTNYWNIAQKESLACLPLAVALYFFLGLVQMMEAAGEGTRAPSETISESAGKSRAMLLAAAGLAGLFTGFGAQFKPTLGIMVLLLFYPAWLVRRERRKAWLVLVCGAAGFMASFVPTVLYLSARGALKPMTDSMLMYGGFYGGQEYHSALGVISIGARKVVVWAYNWRFLTALALIAAVRSWRRERTVMAAALCGVLLLMQVIIQMKFFTYHWIPLLLPGSLLAAKGAGDFLGADAGAGSDWKGRRRALALVLAALFLGNLLPEAGRYRREVLYDLGMTDQISFLAPYGPWGKGDICPLAQEEVAKYIKKRTTPRDSILVVGNELGLYVMAKRFAPTRFAYDQPLYLGNGGLLKRLSGYAIRLNFLKELDSRPPAYILVLRNDQTSIEPEDSYTQLNGFKEFKKFIDEHYYLETIIEDYMIYRKLPPSAKKGTQ